ncbi:hypothetical protein TNCV_4770591 [Trichonephila clavipes]|nr:hypothetical protein TNCV_4770591 [Trichonephila clavipes]
MEGKSCVWAEDVLIAVGIFGLCLDDSGASNFKDGQSILVIFSSVWVKLFKVEDLATFLRHHLELQDRRDYTPADRAARTCWLGCPGLSGDLRRKTQLFSVTLYMAASSKTPPH